jgi:predicted acyl esterase
MLKSSILICVCLFVIQSINGLTTEPHGYKVEELNVTTRDGVDLHTVIVFPHDMKKNGGKYPVIMDRSPYGYFGNPIY